MISFAVLDEDIGKDNVMQNPQLYVDGQKNTLFTPFKFISWLLTAVYQANKLEDFIDFFF